MKKKLYIAPKITKIVFESRCAVLGFCKTTNVFGPMYDGRKPGPGPRFGCGPAGISCRTLGS